MVSDFGKIPVNIHIFSRDIFFCYVVIIAILCYLNGL